jgi:SAM-dependent methyltransferase
MPAISILLCLDRAQWLYGAATGISSNVVTLDHPRLFRRESMIRRRLAGDPRTMEQLRRHYEIEKQLAARLRNSTREERKHLYAALYDELHRAVPEQPRLTRKNSPERRKQFINYHMRFLGQFLFPDTVFLEIGPGDCVLALAIAERVQKVYAVDVSSEALGLDNTPPNFQLCLSDGTSIPVPPGSVDVAFSSQLMEHLHPDDAADQLRNIFTALRPGGVYICVTPNRLSGPHDISRFFENVATGFHLKEYTLTELRDLFTDIGFTKLKAYVGIKITYIRLPVRGVIVLESLLEGLPSRLRRMIGSSFPMQVVLGIRLVARKPCGRAG